MGRKGMVRTNENWLQGWTDLLHSPSRTGERASESVLPTQTQRINKNKRPQKERKKQTTRSTKTKWQHSQDHFLRSGLQFILTSEELAGVGGFSMELEVDSGILEDEEEA